MTLKQKMILPLVGSVLVSVLFGLPFVVQKFKQLRFETIQTIVDTKQLEISHGIEMAGQNAVDTASRFTRHPSVLKAYVLAHSGNIDDENDQAAQQARELLRTELKPLLEGYEAQAGQKLKLHFHLPNGRSLVRLWREKQTKRNGTWVDVSDDISSFRNTVLDVNKSGNKISGIELGRGGFVVRGLMPIKAPDGTQLGSSEVLVDFKPIFQKSTGKDQQILLYMNIDKLPITKNLQDQTKYPVLDERFVLVSGSKDGILEKKISSDLLSKGQEKAYIEAQGHGSSMAAFPVKDYKGEQIGVMVMFLDTTYLEANFHDVLIVLAVTISAMLFLIIAVNYIVLVKAVINPVNQISNNLVTNAIEVTGASNEVSSASQTLAEGASEAAASIEETSSSIEEISSMTSKNADNSQLADSLMNQSVEMINIAHGSMQELTGSMQEIQAGSEETSKIIKTIDEIAFQTNLLALNAAVEAARAGEAGAGFAVVADEVRNLAMRAAEAARDTSGMIESTVQRVQRGAQKVETTNKAFSKVLEGSRKVAQLVAEIAQASSEQSQGIVQVNRAMNELDQITQQNASNAEEAAAASEELNAMAEQMHALSESLTELVSGAGSQKGNEEVKKDVSASPQIFIKH